MPHIFAIGDVTAKLMLAHAAESMGMVAAETIAGAPWEGEEAMVTADLIWGGPLVAGAAFEGHALANGRGGDTLSERTRVWFRVHTRPGWLAFLVGWLGFPGWFLVHILGGR